MTREQYDRISSRLPHKRYTRAEVVKSEYAFPKSTSKEDIIQWLIDSCFIENYILQLTDYNDTRVDDYIQEIYLCLLELPQERWDDLTFQGFGCIKSYVSGMIYRQLKSKNSPIYYKYKRTKEKEVNISSKMWDNYDKTNKIMTYEEVEQSRGDEDETEM